MQREQAQAEGPSHSTVESHARHLMYGVHTHARAPAHTKAPTHVHTPEHMHIPRVPTNLAGTLTHRLCKYSNYGLARVTGVGRNFPACQKPTPAGEG